MWQENEKINGILDEMTKTNQNMQERIELLEKENEELRENFKSEMKDIHKAIEELQNDVLELTTRPCACR